MNLRKLAISAGVVGALAAPIVSAETIIFYTGAIPGVAGTLRLATNGVLDAGGPDIVSVANGASLTFNTGLGANTLTALAFNTLTVPDQVIQDLDPTVAGLGVVWPALTWSEVATNKAMTAMGRRMDFMISISPCQPEE